MLKCRRGVPVTIDVIYQGLTLVKGANARAETGGLFVEVEAPMPVGTRLELVTPEGVRSGRVGNVVEGMGAGMWVGLGELKVAEPNAPMAEMKSAPSVQVVPAPEPAVLGSVEPAAPELTTPASSAA